MGLRWTKPPPVPVRALKVEHFGKGWNKRQYVISPRFAVFLVKRSLPGKKSVIRDSDLKGIAKIFLELSPKNTLMTSERSKFESDFRAEILDSKRMNSRSEVYRKFVLQRLKADNEDAE